MESRWYSSAWSFVSETWMYFMSFRPTRMASSLSYYAIFALVPILVVTFWMGNFLVENDNWSAEIISKVSYVLGPQSSEFIQTTFVQSTSIQGWSLAAFVAIALLVFLAAQGVGELKKSLDEIWQAPKETEQNFFAVLSRFIVSVIGVFAFGMSFVVYLLISKLFEQGFSLGIETTIGQGVAIVGGPIVLLLITFFGTMIAYQILPATKIGRRYRIVGALLTSGLLTIGNVAIGYYMSHGASLSTYGVAGSLVALLLWFYYSSLIFLLGASATWIFAKWEGWVASE